MTDLSVIIPVYNEEANIQQLIDRLQNAVAKLNISADNIFANDGSRDKSVEVIRSLVEQIPRLRLVEHGSNLGYGAVLRTGFREACKELVFYTDGDGQYDVKELEGMLQAMNDGVDMVNGYKIRRCDSWGRVFIGKSYLFAMRFFFRFRVRDLDCDFRLLRRRLLDSLQLRSTSGAICLELVKKAENAGCHILDYPVHHHPRAYGRSQFFRVRWIWRTLLEVLKLRHELRATQNVGRKK